MSAARLHLARGPAASRRSNASPAASIRVLLADGHDLMRRGLRSLLDGEQDVEVVAEASDLDAVKRYCERYLPDVLAFDLDMPGASGFKAVEQLREQVRDTQVVVLTMADSPVFAKRAFAAGALGFVGKDLADTELLPAVRAAARGEEYVSPRVAGRLSAMQSSLTDDLLTPRGVEVLRLTSLGHTSVEIARRLHLSVRTIETHRAHIYGKLGLATRAELVRYSLRHGLIGN